MHNHVANRGRKALLKQIFSVFLIFVVQEITEQNYHYKY